MELYNDVTKFIAATAALFATVLGTFGGFDKTFVMYSAFLFIGVTACIIASYIHRTILKDKIAFLKEMISVLTN